ncbi:hypothetical protein [Streptomyces sp. NPDC047928]|uniref:hypothetical protein n=1 Tax=unclassified Streptomyces TaxID=2593676 RepID=UPI0037150E51
MPQQQPQRRQPSDVSMRDLLASCAAANAVSTPPPVSTAADGCEGAGEGGRGERGRGEAGHGESGRGGATGGTGRDGVDLPEQRGACPEAA